MEAGAKTYVIDRSEMVEHDERDHYRLKVIRFRGPRMEVHSGDLFRAVGSDEELLDGADVPGDVVALGSSLLIPVETADSGQLATRCWMDLGRAPSGPRPGDEPAPGTEAATLLRLASAGWPVERYGTDRRRDNPAKEALLRRSLELVRGQKGNEQVVQTIVKKALKAGLVDLAMEGVEAFGADSAWWMCWAIKELLDEPDWWLDLDDAFLDYCERRVLTVTGERELQSGVLAQLGEIYFFFGDGMRTADLWAKATNRRQVDEVIERMCDLIAREDESRVPEAPVLRQHPPPWPEALVCQQPLRESQLVVSAEAAESPTDGNGRPQ